MVAAKEEQRSLPYPYQQLKEPLTAYEKYLKTTPMIADRQFCEKLLLEKLKKKTKNPKSATWIWVTPPILAIGTMGRLWSLTEAHVVYPKSSDKMVDRTFSCFVRYAKKSEKEIWQQGKLRYGRCLKKGHKKFVMCRARTVASALPGKSSSSLEGVLVP